MTPQELRNRTKKFAVNIIKFAKTSISSDPIDQEIGKQLTGAVGATAAGYRATCRARSRKACLAEASRRRGRADAYFRQARQTARNRRFDPERSFVS